MSSEPQSPNAYDAVLADLHAQRDKIDQAIALLTTLRGGAAPLGAMPVAANEPAILETAGMFLGMSIVEASKKLLGMRKRTMGNPEIAKELQAGGLVLNSKEPANVIGSVLTRRFNEAGDVVKVGRGIWGLKEWYPGRTFKPSGKAAAMIAEAVEQVDEPAPPPPIPPAPPMAAVAPPPPVPVAPPPPPQVNVSSPDWGPKIVTPGTAAPWGTGNG